MPGSHINPSDTSPRPRWGSILAGLAAVATIIGVLWGIWWGIFIYQHPTLNSTTPAPSASPGTAVPARATSSSIGRSPAATSYPTPLVTCLTKNQAVACTSSHTQEIVPADACTLAGLVRYMGGSVETDVLRSTITFATTAAKCTVTLPEPIAFSLANALAQPSSAMLRRCYTTATATPREIGCAAPHNTEAIRLYPAHSATSVSCDAAAAIYLNLPQDQWSDVLATTNHTLTSGDTQCVIGPRSDSVLTATLRNIRNDALPLAPA